MKSAESWVLTYLLNSLWQVPLLLGAGWVAARLARRVGAAMEHAVWVAVLILQSVLPACSAISSTVSGAGWWEPWLRHLMAWRFHAHASGGSGVAVVMEPGMAGNRMPISAMLLTIVAAAYVLISVWFAARFLLSWLRAARILRSAMPVEQLPGEAASVWARCSKHFGVADASIRVSPDVPGPMAMGAMRRIVLMPGDMLAGLPEDDLQAALAHECAHLRRRDYLANLVLQVLALPASYHPLSALTRARVMESREMVCDQLAAEMTGPKAYARSLLRLAAVLLEGMPLPVPHAIGLFDANVLERRLMKLTAKQGEMRGARRLAVMLACATVGVGVCGSALAMGMHVNAVSAQSDEGTPTKYPTKIAVASGLIAGNKIGGAQPEYPAEAKKARVQGTVVLGAEIGKDGKIKGLVVKSGPKLLQKSALDAVKGWLYKPFLLNGEPVEVETEINVIYSLADSSKPDLPPPPPPASESQLN
ncbi:M56 family metallopeptidase [Silvibacterium sp.]|uniref:M56 family metallopeptidase n=1 Tax=Silvibacterium sp. TaxID=1964179 RepID=UPI0039E578D4